METSKSKKNSRVKLKKRRRRRKRTQLLRQSSTKVLRRRKILFQKLQTKRKIQITVSIKPKLTVPLTQMLASAFTSRMRMANASS